MATLNVRMSEEEYGKLIESANKLGLSISEYIRLIINLDVATGIINKLKEI